MLTEYLSETYNSFDINKFILDKEIYYTMIISHLCWWLLYAFVHFCIKVNHKTLKDVNDTKTRIISIAHASLIFWASTYDVIFNQVDKCGQPNTKFQTTFMIISCTYFLYDLIACILLGVSDAEMVYHHLMCILGYYTGISYNNSANEMLRALVVSEITCPIMHLRMILKNYGLKHTKMHNLLDIVYMFLYIVARLGYGSTVVYFTVFCRNNLILVKIAGAFVWIQSVRFAIRMVKILKDKYKEYKERSQKGVELFWLNHNKKVEELNYYKKIHERLSAGKNKEIVDKKNKEVTPNGGEENKDKDMTMAPEKDNQDELDEYIP
jgi:hypothetical protein